MNEVLRLYPPAYIMARETVEPCQIGGYEFRSAPRSCFRSGSRIAIRAFSTIPMHSVPSAGLTVGDRLPPGAYFPFGAGPRRCIGQGFALLEAAMVIGTLAQRFRFASFPARVVPEPLVTLRPRNGIRMTLHARN